MLYIAPHIKIPLSEISFSFARGSGPGGQNVNKVNSKAVLTWNIVQSPSIPQTARARFLAVFPNRINSAGEVVVSSDRFRDQGKNVSDCLEKLRTMLSSIARPPKPRLETSPTRSSQEARLKEKKARSQRKQNRQKHEW